ncbi:MAG: hypothetical protein Q7J55_06635 [bacterium]|nr:hypothetical protein [bacterium]
MYQENKIEALLALKESGRIVKMLKFYLRPKAVEVGSRSTTFEQTFDKSSYMLTLMTGKETLTFEQQLGQGTPWISISSPKEMALSDRKLPNFLNSIISEDDIRKQIQEHINSFMKGR